MKRFPMLAMVMLAGSLSGASVPVVKHVLFFSKAASWEKRIVHPDDGNLSLIEKAVDRLGKASGIDFTFAKDGRLFRPEFLAQYDALMFFTSGDLTSQKRNGRGDNFPLMSLAGKQAFLDAIDKGMGFIGCNTAVYTFTERLSPGEADVPANAWRYTQMIGAGYIGHNEVQMGHLTHLDRAFPGMETVPGDYRPVDQWYGFSRFMPDLHVIMALDARQLTGNLYEREPYPVAWARMQGKGRVYYTTMGHTAAMWEDATFLQMLLGGIRWATKLVDADVTPDLDKVTPHANEVPERASKFIADHPPVVDPHFPNFKVWLDKEHPMHGGKRVLVYTKSSGHELPLVYRDTAWPSALESELLRFGDEHGVDFVFTKEGALFTDEGLREFDAILFFTSGDPRVQERNGIGDNYPLMPKEGMLALLRAVREGKGFIGLHSSGSFATESLLGAGRMTFGHVDKLKLRVVDPGFPGMGKMPPGIIPWKESGIYGGSGPDMHPLLTTDDGRTVAWARMEGKGRVYYTSFGSTEETWRDENFRALLLGAIHWVTREAGGDIVPDGQR